MRAQPHRGEAFRGVQAVALMKQFKLAKAAIAASRVSVSAVAYPDSFPPPAN
jgi:hypothetical protein